jgi:hypothetical protein
MTKRHAKPTSAKKRKPPTTAQMVGRIPKWLTGFEERLTNQMKAMQRDNEKNARLLEVILYDSKEAREDNLPTLPRLHRAIENGDAHLRVTARTLTDHCARLLKEKETLQRQVERMQALAPEQSIAAQDQSPFDPFEYNSVSSLARMEMSHKVIDIMQPPIPTLIFETRWYPCGCSATGNGIQPLPDYCATHGKDGHFQAPFDLPTVCEMNSSFEGSPGDGMPKFACTLAHLHRPGVRCGVCGEVPDAA